MSKVILELTREEAVVALSALKGQFSVSGNASAGAPAPSAPATPPAGAYVPPAAPTPPAAPAHVAHTPPAQPTNTAGGHTLQSITQLAQAYAKAYSPKAAKDVLAKFSLSKISDAQPAIFQQLADALTVAAA